MNLAQGGRLLLSAATSAAHDDRRLRRWPVLRISPAGPDAVVLGKRVARCTVLRLQIGLPTARIVTLRWLLKHNGWLHKTKGGHGRPRTSSDLELRHCFYVGSLFILVGRHPRWLSLQDALPRLPVPSLEHTRDQLLETVRPIVNDHQYIQCQKAFSAFMQPDGEGKQLQARAPASHRRAPLSTRREPFVPVPVARPLRAQALLLREHQRKPRSSWLADWFLEYKYLRKREPLVYFSNWSPPPPPPCAALFAVPLMRVCRGACAVLRFGGRAGTGSTGRIRRAKGR